MKNIFKPEDFEQVISQETYPDTPDFYARERLTYNLMVEDAVEIANEKLNKLIESWPVVWFNDDKTMSPYWEASSRQDKLHTHKAHLAFVEKINQAPEEYHYIETGLTVNNEPMYKRVRK